MSDFSHLCGLHVDKREVDKVLATLPVPYASDGGLVAGSGAGKTILLYEFVEKITGRKLKLRTQVGPDCFNPSALVRMSDGTEKHIVDVQIGEEVITPMGNIRKVIDKIIKPSQKHMVRIHVAGYPVTLDSTPDHLYMQLPNIGRGKHGDKNEYQWTESISLNEGDYILLPKLCNDKEFQYDLSKLGLDYSFLSKDKIQAKKSKHIINRFITLDEKLSWLIGIYSAEGGCHTKNNIHKQITFNLSSKEVLLAEKIKQYIQDVFGLQAKIKTVKSKPSCLFVEVYNIFIATLFKKLCTGNVYSKKLNPELLLSNYNNKIQLLSGWMAGDGYQNKIGVSVSKSLIIDYFNIANSIGINCTVIKRKAYKQSKESYSLNINVTTSEKIDIQYAVQLKRTRMTKYGKAAKITKIEIVEPETDKVYCIGVEKDHAFICNGYGVHNCVSMGAAMAVDIVKAVQSILEGTNQEWIAETATEPLYGGSRVEIGRGQLGNGGGSMGVWAAKYVNQYGTLPRGKYGNIDLSVYDYSKAEAWGRPRGGVPDSLEEESRKNCIKTISLIRTWEELRDAIANGYAVTIASGQGFSSTRDKDGFARPSGSWPHQMCIGAAKDDNRPGGLILNSWGAWNNGPKGEFDIPEGSFWCDAQVLERNILSQGDSWAFSNLDGYPARELDLRWS